MFTTNLKRSVAALAVTAGLLAAAVPASHAYSFGIHTDAAKAPVSSALTAGVDRGSEGLIPEDAVSGNKTLKVDSNEVAEDITLAHEGWRAPVEDMDLSIRGAVRSSDRTASGPDFDDVVGGNKTLKADSNEVAVEGITLAHEGWSRYGVVADAGDDRITQAGEPASVTMMDYELNPVVTY